MEPTSIYVIDCCTPECAKKNNKIRSTTLDAKCPECGLEIRVESWRIKYTLTAEGKLINEKGEECPDGSARAEVGKGDAGSSAAR